MGESFESNYENERSILRLLKLIECDNGKIGSYAKLVDDRNASAHPNGNIFYSEPSALDRKISEILRVADEIQTHSKSVIEHCYQKSGRSKGRILDAKVGGKRLPPAEFESCCRR